MALLPGGIDYLVNPSSPDLTGFDPARDRLDFGDTSVHGLILGKLPDGSAILVNPWQSSDYQRILGVDGEPILWSQLSVDNLGVVGNEHLRQDAGGALSWELGVGPGAEWPNEQRTVYVRSHEWGVQERVEGFDPQTDKLNFLYLGTRERLSAVDTDEGLLISVEPSGQSILLVGVLGEELVGRNLEFHFDQIEEDNLEDVFGFPANALSLVDRSDLLTPQAPAGQYTDGTQTRTGTDALSEGVSGEPSMSDHTSHDDHADHAGGNGMSAPVVSTDGLELSVSGTLYWGGMSGQLTLTNAGGSDVEDWSVSFMTLHRNVQSWSGGTEIEALEGGLYRVTLTPAAWNGVIAAGQSIALSFNAESEGLPTSGELTEELFFASMPDVVGDVEEAPPADDNTDHSGEGGSTAEMSPMEEEGATDLGAHEDPVDQGEPGAGETGVPDSPVSTGDLELAVSGNLYWGGMSGQLTLTNTGGSDVEGWSVSFTTPHRNVQSWSGGTEIEALEGGLYRVTLTPAAWNGVIAAGQSIALSFNAESEGLPTSGELTDALFFASAPAVEGILEDEPADLADQMDSPEATDVVVGESADPGEVDPSVQGDFGALDGSPSTDLDSPGAEANDAVSPSQSGKRIVGYFEEWGIYSRDFLVQDIQVEDLTHVNYSFFDVRANGELEIFDDWAATQKRFTVNEQVSRTFSAQEWSELDSARIENYRNASNFSIVENADQSVTVSGQPVGWDQNDVLAGNLRQFQLLKALNPELELGLALGGWTLSDEFSLALDDAAGREQFTDNVIDTLERYTFFTTVDFDWEYPGGGGLSSNAVSPDDGENFALTLELLRSKLDALEVRSGRDYEISIATSATADKLAALNLQGVDPFVDFYNVMAYDFHGGWELSTGHQAAMTGDPSGYDVVTAVETFKDSGVALNKVVLGAPAYTRAWGDVITGDALGYGEVGRAASAPGSFEAGNYDQKDLITGIESGDYQLAWDDDALAAYAYNASTQVWSSIETPSTIAGKAAFVEAADLGGMMFWALSNDSADEQSLIAAASDLLRMGVSAESVVARSPEFDQVFGGDGQFNLSDFTDLAA